MKRTDLNPPPPERQPKHHLSLKASMPDATQSEGHQASKSHSHLVKAMSSTASSAQQDMEAHLLELQAEIINREALLNQREKQLIARELELNEKEALLEARKKIIESS